MGCKNSKQDEIPKDIEPYVKKKQRRLRCIAGVEAKELEFNVQVSLVHVGDECFEHISEKPTK